MTTKLTKIIRREISIGNEAHTVTISPEGIKAVPKGRRKGRTLTWTQLIMLSRIPPSEFEAFIHNRRGVK